MPTLLIILAFALAFLVSYRLLRKDIDLSSLTDEELQIESYWLAQEGKWPNIYSLEYDKRHPETNV